MPFHDDYLRLTPFELAFPEGSQQCTRLAEIAEEASARGADTGDLGAFAMLGSVNGVLRELGGPEASAEAIVQYAALVFHAFHLHEAGAPALLLRTSACRHLVETGWDGTAVPLPGPAGYAQLPRNLFWIHTAPDTPAEAVDGFFWTASRNRLHLLLVTGVLEGRPGFGVVPIPDAPLDEAASWVGGGMRAEGRDFETTLPGGEMEGLYSFVTAGEVLTLAARLFGYLASAPAAAQEMAPPGGSPTPAPSRWVCRRVGIEGAADGTAPGA